MLVIDWDDFLNSGLPTEGEPVSMTVGVFDGVHRGHQALIKRIVPRGRTVVVTFREPNHKSGKTAANIQTFKEKAAALECLGVEILIVIDFTESFRRIAGIEFLEILHKHANIGFFAVGANFRCGYRKDTDAAAVRDFFASRGIPVEIVPETLHGGLPISSSRIRAALADGDLELARVMLGVRKEHTLLL